MLCNEENKPLVNFIARYENRREDLAYVGEQIGLPGFGQSMALRRTPSKYDYREYYDDELRDKVAAACRWEIERFNYTFD